MSNARKRNNHGASLTLVVIATMAIIIVGVGVVLFLRIFGGSGEVQNAADSGTLNVAKEALLSPGISLVSNNNGVDEQENFGAFTATNGTLDLLSYNRIVGQTLLVALNAQAEATPQAEQNANALIGALYSPTASISQRLRDALQNWNNSAISFSNTALANSTRMLTHSNDSGVASGFQIAYADAGAPTNIYLTQNMMTDGGLSLDPGALSNVKSPSSGEFYLKGYTDIAVGGLATIAGVTVNPLQQPHLISTSTFQSAQTNPVQAGAIPPNSFQSAAKVQSTLGSGLTNVSCSEVGVLGQDYPASIPHGYIVISNLPGDPMPAGMTLPSNESIFNNQLFTGIFIANNGAFSTDESQIQAWADYNNGGQVGTPPSTDGLFNAQGAPVAGQQNGITSLGGNGYPVMADYTNVQGSNANPAAAAMLPAFETAYPSSLDAGTPADGTLTAVEELKAEVMQLYTSGTGGTPSQPVQTGLRVFNHSQTYPSAPGQSPVFTTPGNIAQLCAQSDPSGSPAAICSEIKQRMLEMNPDATDAQIDQILGLASDGQTPLTSGAQTIDLGQTFYIWYDGNEFMMAQSLPPWVSSAPATSAVDGSPSPDASNYETIGYSVDPIGESGFNATLFDEQPNADTTDLGIDTTTWTPSSGYNNLLGMVTFGESISGSSLTLASNPIPTNPAPTNPPPTNPVTPVTPVTAVTPSTSPTTPVTPVASCSTSQGAQDVQNYLSQFTYIFTYDYRTSASPFEFVQVVPDPSSPVPGAENQILTPAATVLSTLLQFPGVTGASINPPLNSSNLGYKGTVTLTVSLDSSAGSCNLNSSFQGLN